MDFFNLICLFFRILAGFQLKNAMLSAVFGAISLEYGIIYVSLHTNCEKRITK